MAQPARGLVSVSLGPLLAGWPCACCYVWAGPPPAPPTGEMRGPGRSSVHVTKDPPRSFHRTSCPQGTECGGSSSAGHGGSVHVLHWLPKPGCAGPERRGPTPRRVGFGSASSALVLPGWLALAELCTVQRGVGEFGDRGCGAEPESHCGRPRCALAMTRRASPVSNPPHCVWESRGGTLLGAMNSWSFCVCAACGVAAHHLSAITMEEGATLSCTTGPKGGRGGRQGDRAAKGSD